jgi:hypothetical protein
MNVEIANYTLGALIGYPVSSRKKKTCNVFISVCL